MTTNPFHLASLVSAVDAPSVPPLLQPGLSWLLGLGTYRRLYQAAVASDEPFEDRALASLDIRVRDTGAGLAAIPADGPLIVVANHPHGALDGLALTALVGKVRPDVRVLANLWLSGIPELADRCFFVDPFDGPAAMRRSRAGLRAARAWLASGGSLIVFPAGEVAHAIGFGDTPVDSPWHSTAARLAAASNAAVVPAFISGRNSPLFYTAGRLHPAFRTLLLARELLGQQHRTVSVCLGAPLPEGHRPAGGDWKAATRVLRAAVERLEPRSAGSYDTRVDVSRPDAAGQVRRDVRRLPSASCLVETDTYQVFHATARQIPHALVEIGRLREAAYREIGEGTGRACDLDRFDEHYLHLFLWDRRQQRIAGAYRIGRTDEIITRRGVHGLYTRSLFSYDDTWLAQLPPALELGRAFVRADYQKSYGALLLLWRGIAQYVVRHPHYRMLFGCVSVSRAYTDRSRAALIAFLRAHHADQDKGAVAPLAPFIVNVADDVSGSVEALNRFVVDQEPDGKGMPVLLRHYLKLNARLVGVNVDAAFGNALDALMLVNLDTVEPAVLRRFFGC